MEAARRLPFLVLLEGICLASCLPYCVELSLKEGVRLELEHWTTIVSAYRIVQLQIPEAAKIG